MTKIAVQCVFVSLSLRKLVLCRPPPMPPMAAASTAFKTTFTPSTLPPPPHSPSCSPPARSLPLPPWQPSSHGAQLRPVRPAPFLSARRSSLGHGSPSSSTSAHLPPRLPHGMTPFLLTGSRPPLCRSRNSPSHGISPCCCSTYGG
jgi:hypothetical protein